ncbi:type 1 fimbrial protein [Pseudomonas sp. CCM 7893]|uniref:Type 1 fimbrial protein n=1 Tax=Pseudomonas spelaei TaxID=1055469 RepID=A0A6I3WL62_9PSED|nr:type 1 fimbrial protein [Pseudomonas spelaei]MUF08103.1 type 1 fimbrial protein [Pseudomonas spelaei]QLG92874.1 type 1 fimbrial protein [Pseudomonas yamanorum]
MNLKRLSVVMGLFFVMVESCGAASQVGQGVIQFHGSIVEPGCASSASGAVMELKGCSPASRGSQINVRRVQPVSSVTALDHSAVSARLVADSGQGGRYYDQQYALVDSAGKPVHSGMYLITLTSP